MGWVEREEMRQEIGRLGPRGEWVQQQFPGFDPTEENTSSFFKKKLQEKLKCS